MTRAVFTRSRWHTDIKPDNILFVEDSIKEDDQEMDPNKFKLADPGFAKFVRKPPNDSRGVPKQVLEGGTETYGMY